MMKRILFALPIIAMLISCGGSLSTTTQATNTSDCVEVLYFHGKQRCITCNAIERLTKEVVENDFAPQLKSGELVFNIIDISTKEGEKIAQQYEVTWSALFIDRHNMTKFGFSHAKSSPEIFKAEVKKRLEESLK